MAIERITGDKLIGTILGLQDERLEKQVGCSKAEWVQHLIEMAKIEGYMGIWGLTEKKHVKRYMVAVNGIMPPISHVICILYQNFFSDNENGMLALLQVKNWGRSLGAEKIVIQTLYPRINEKFGFHKEPGETMYMDI